MAGLTSLAVVAIAALLPLSPIGRSFGFVRPPVALYGIIFTMTAVYLVAAEAMKRWFFGRARAGI